MSGFSDLLPQITNAAINNPVSKFFEQGAENVAQDIGTGLGYNQAPGLQNSQNNTMAIAQQAENKASKVTDPAEKARLHAVASQAYQQVSQNASQQAQSYSPDVQQNPLLRAGNAATQIATGADIAAHPISTVKGVLNIAKGGLKAIAHPIQTLDTGIKFLENPLPPIINFAKNELANPNTGKLVKPDTGITKMGNRVLAGQFKGASNVTKNPAQTMGNLSRYGLSKPEDISNAAQKVTGSADAPEGQAVLNKAVTKAVQSGGRIDMGEIKDENGAIQRPSMTDTASATLKDTDFLSPNQRKDLLQKVINATQKTPANLAVLPEKALVTLRGWEAKASNAIDLHGNFKPNLSAEEKETAQFYQTMSKELSQRIFGDSGVGAQPLSDFLSNNDMKVLQGIHPQLAADAQGTSVQGGRSLQSDFVNGSKMANANAGAESGPLSTGEALTTAAGLASGNPLAYGATLAQTRPGMNAIGNGLRTIGGLNSGAAQTALDLPAIVSNTKNNNQQTQNTPNHNLPPITASAATPPTSGNNSTMITQVGGNVNDKGYGMSVKNTPQSVGDVKLNPDGTVNAAAPSQMSDANGKTIAEDPNTITNQITALQTANSGLQAAAASQNSNIAKPAQGTIAANNDKINALTNLKTSVAPVYEKYNNLKQVTGATNTALQTLSRSNINVSDLNSQIDTVQNSLDPYYADLKQQLAGIQKKIGGGNLDVTTQDSLTAVLKRINQQNVYDYYTNVATYASPTATSPGGAALSSQFTPQANTAPAASNTDFSNIVGGALPTIGSNNAGLPTSQ